MFCFLDVMFTVVYVFGDPKMMNFGHDPLTKSILGIVNPRSLLMDGCWKEPRLCARQVFVMVMQSPWWPKVYLDCKKTLRVAPLQLTDDCG